MRYPELGRLLTQMVKSLNAQHNRKMAGTMKYLADRLVVNPDTIYKWRQGKHKPSLEVLAKLVDIGVAEAGMDQGWAERVFYQGEHPDRVAWLRRLFPAKEEPIRHNLPRRPYIRLVGREKQLASIRSRLTPESRHWLVPIEGVSGVGKSALALEVGWYFVENYDRLPPGRRFTAVVWVSAKRELLTARGIVSSQPTLTNLADIYYAISEVLEWPVIRRVSHEEQRHEVRKALQHAGSVLLILDNLETVDDENVLSFLRELPLPAKAVVTMRFHEDMPYPIRLRELDKDAARELVYQECAARTLTLLEGQIELLLASTRGQPLAISWAIGLMAMEGYGIEATLCQLANPEGDLQRFEFSEAKVRLQKHYPAALEVLKALTYFDLDTGATIEALGATVGIDCIAVEQALQRLLNLNLVNRQQSGTRFTMLPLTCDFARQEITPEWEIVARTRWANYFYDFARQHLVLKSGKPRYWNTLVLRDPMSIRVEWRNFLNVFAWADEQEQAQTLIELMMLLVHYMDWYLVFAERLDYAQKAAQAASKLGQKVDEAFLRIDALGWTLIEVGRFKDAIHEITTGLHIAFSLASKGEEPIANDLIALAHTFLARVYLEQDDYSKASSTIKHATSIDCRPVAWRRVCIMAGDVACINGDNSEAIKWYKDAILMSVGDDGEAQYVGTHYRLGFAYLTIGKLEEAENIFEQVEQLGVTVERLYAKFGLARIAQLRGQIDKARHLAKPVFAELSSSVPAHRLLKQVKEFLQEIK